MSILSRKKVNFVGITNYNIGEKIINPNKIVLKEGETYYPLEVAKNYLIIYK